MIETLIQQAGSSILLLCLGLVLVSFVFEDVAIVAGAGLVMQGMLSPVTGFAVVAGGIALGDFGLYAAGRAARRFAWVRRQLDTRMASKLAGALDRNLVSSVLLARILPGLRLPTYTGAGLIRSHFTVFAVTDMLAVLLWTALLMTLGLQVMHRLALWLGLPHWAIIAALALAVVVLPLLFRRGRRSPQQAG